MLLKHQGHTGLNINMNESTTSLNISQQLIKKMQLPESFKKIVNDIYNPLMQLILERKQQQPLFISINGAQGTGKSTLTHFLKHLIEAESGFAVAEISLDDFYITYAERQQLATDIHPLLLTRGVPGTHDIKLMENTFSALLEGKPCTVPRFNKSIDDREDDNKWNQFNNHTPIDVILFEGWCNNSPIQTPEELITPINTLEQHEDENGIWRTYANEQLKIYHEKIFSHSDMRIMLKASGFERIYAWRLLQEEKLKQNTVVNKHTKIMSNKELQRFIQHYERISRHTLNKLPSLADIVIPINDDHSIERIIQKNEK